MAVCEEEGLEGTAAFLHVPFSEEGTSVHEAALWQLLEGAWSLHFPGTAYHA